MAQPEPFSSTTTATGLPSTPSRNASLQPQARRACVNPFSMSESYYSNPRSKQRFDFLLELFLRCDARMLLRNASFAVDEDRHRNAPQRSERILYVLASVADEHRVIHLHLRRVGLQLLDGVVNRDAENDDVFPFLGVGLLELD